MSRTVVWFSCGAASAVAAKLSDPSSVVVYCDTSNNEHQDNKRFFLDVEKWLGRKIEIIRSAKFSKIEDVFEKTRYMSGPSGARCTVEMKKKPRQEFEMMNDVHIFGFTADEQKRVSRFSKNNPEMLLKWPLLEAGITKSRCFEILKDAGIEIPVMYKLGYKNNNCIGCVKATSPRYWAKVRKDFPEVFAQRSMQSREIGCRLTRIGGRRIFLDELPDIDYRELEMDNVSCGPECGIEEDKK